MVLNFLQNVVTAGGPGSDEVVTIPRDMFVHLIDQNNVAATGKNRECAQKCICTCQCGKYQAGKLIVDEVELSL